MRCSSSATEVAPVKPCTPNLDGANKFEPDHLSAMSLVSLKQNRTPLSESKAKLAPRLCVSPPVTPEIHAFLKLISGTRFSVFFLFVRLIFFVFLFNLFFLFSKMWSASCAKASPLLGRGEDRQATDGTGRLDASQREITDIDDTPIEALFQS